MLLFLIMTLAMNVDPADGGPALAVGCVATCNAAAVACYAGAGLTFGTITAGVGAPIAAILCNLAQGTCMSACVVSVVAPTP